MFENIVGDSSTQHRRLRLGKESREPTSGRATYLKIEKKQLAKVIQIIERELEGKP